MTIDEAARQWKVSIDKVKRWKKECRFPYDNLKDGTIDIPDIRKPIVINRNMKVTPDNVRKKITKAFNEPAYIGVESFMGNLSAAEFGAYMDQLEKEGVISRTSDWQNNQSNIGYIYNGQKKERDISINVGDVNLGLLTNPSVIGFG